MTNIAKEEKVTGTGSILPPKNILGAEIKTT
jgi:hypothetical protein